MQACNIFLALKTQKCHTSEYTRHICFVCVCFFLTKYVHFDTQPQKGSLPMPWWVNVKILNLYLVPAHETGQELILVTHFYRMKPISRPGTEMDYVAHSPETET